MFLISPTTHWHLQLFEEQSNLLEHTRYISSRCTDIRVANILLEPVVVFAHCSIKYNIMVTPPTRDTSTQTEPVHSMIIGEKFLKAYGKDCEALFNH